MKKWIIILMVMVLLFGLFGCVTTKTKIKNKIVNYVINTFVDGYDVQQVNLWSAKKTRTEVTGVGFNGDKVKVLKREGEYVKIKILKSGKVGWCMDGYIKAQ